ncbi:MAG: hypothetical protein AAGJ50_03860, partial [Pseudomonadota bacterium]
MTDTKEIGSKDDPSFFGEVLKWLAWFGTFFGALGAVSAIARLNIVSPEDWLVVFLDGYRTVMEPAYVLIDLMLPKLQVERWIIDISALYLSLLSVSVRASIVPKLLAREAIEARRESFSRTFDNIGGLAPGAEGPPADPVFRILAKSIPKSIMLLPIWTLSPLVNWQRTGKSLSARSRKVNEYEASDEAIDGLRARIETVD